jgi:hypothetical protein
MERIINFINRTKESILYAMYLLRMRYKTVTFEYKLKNGVYSGYFTVIGRQFTYLKYGF